MDEQHLGLRTERGDFTYPDPTFAQPGFLDVPDVLRTDKFAKLTFPQE